MRRCAAVRTCADVPSCFGKKVVEKKGIATATKPSESYLRIDGIAADVRPSGLAPSWLVEKCSYGYRGGDDGCVQL